MSLKLRRFNSPPCSPITTHIPVPLAPGSPVWLCGCVCGSRVYNASVCFMYMFNVHMLRALCALCVLCLVRADCRFPQEVGGRGELGEEGGVTG